MATALNLVLSADWLAGSMTSWRRHPVFQQHMTSMKEAVIAAMREGDVSGVNEGMSLLKLLMGTASTGT